MKPRQREPQKQTSRLFLRTKDHRDVIYQDKYHNAIWANTDEIDDELVWLKYPKNALLNTYYVGYGTFGWMDVDRQFQYARHFGGAVRGRLFSLECGIVVNVAQVSSSYQLFSISDDGIVWQDMRSENMNPYGLDYFHFGEDGLCWIKISDAIVQDEYWPLDHAGYVVGVVTFSKNEETGRFVCELHQYSFPDVVRTVQFVCNTKQGCIINTTYGGIYDSSDNIGAREYTYWHIDHAGVKNQKYYALWATNSIWDNLARTNNLNSNGFAYAKVDNDCYCIVSTANKHTKYGTTYTYRIQVLHSGDLGDTWDGEALWELTLYSPQTFSMTLNIHVCANEVFALWATAQANGNKCHMFSTTDGLTWSEVALPTWLDVPVVNGGGSGVKQTPSVNTLRIAVDPQNTSDYQLQLGNILGDPRWDSNARGMSIMFSDGELVKESDDVVRFCFGQTGNDGYMVFFDNKYLAENARAFAWQNTTPSDIPDILQQYDYVLG